MGNYFVLQVLTVVFILSLVTTTLNRRIFNLPDAIGVPIASAICVFLLQWATSLLSGNEYITITTLKNSLQDFKVGIKEFVI